MQNLADPIEHANALAGTLGLTEAREIAADNFAGAWAWDDIMYWATIINLLHRNQDRSKEN